MVKIKNTGDDCARLSPLSICHVPSWIG